MKNTDAGDDGYMYVYDINSDKLEQAAAKEVTDRYKTEDITDKLTEIPNAIAEGAPAHVSVTKRAIILDKSLQRYNLVISL